GVMVDLYKDRWSSALRREWDGVGTQPEGHFNAPGDITDAQLKELTAERKVARTNPTTGEILGYSWVRPGHVANELWDLLVYNSAALDILAWDFSVNGQKLFAVDWDAFFEACDEDGLFVE